MSFEGLRKPKIIHLVQRKRRRTSFLMEWLHDWIARMACTGTLSRELAAHLGCISAILKFKRKSMHSHIGWRNSVEALCHSNGEYSVRSPREESLSKSKDSEPTVLVGLLESDCKLQAHCERPQFVHGEGTNCSLGSNFRFSPIEAERRTRVLVDKPMT